jgi:hypothetical protein
MTAHPIDIAASMQDLAAQRDSAAFSKEPVYAARKMSTRLAAQVKDPSSSLSAPAFSFLRRKRRQGRGEGKDSRPPR